MTDLEMTKLCAEAMGDDAEWASACEILRVADLVAETQPIWAGHLRRAGKNAQAMALVKALLIALIPPDETGHWLAGGTMWHAANTDLNRAIVACVAKMQKAKG